MSSKILAIIAMVLVTGGYAGCGSYERGDQAPIQAEDGSTAPVGGGGAGGGVLSFEANIHPLLQNRCAQCHGPNSATAFALSGDATADFAHVNSLINTSDPESSRLLQKGAGLTAHGGGSVLDTASDDYQAVLSWIQEGAPQ